MATKTKTAPSGNTDAIVQALMAQGYDEPTARSMAGGIPAVRKVPAAPAGMMYKGIDSIEQQGESLVITCSPERHVGKVTDKGNITRVYDRVQANFNGSIVTCSITVYEKA